ncbi:MAG: patatin-like phospholipase family protein [Verrucomicrobia bacterium]|nr:patatin-like phospholipase family protein [Verrucomicrobiota bacterium]
MPFALCLNSSFLGVFAHAGFVAGLEERALRPRQLAGASAGAVIAALAATGRSGREIFALLRAADLRSLFFEAGAPLRAAGAALGVRGVTGALRAPRAEKLMRDWFGEARLEELHDPTLRIAVTNVTTARGLAADHGKVWEYVLASCAVPGVFAAREIDGQRYVDGGFADPEPIGAWLGDAAIPEILLHRIDRRDGRVRPPTLGWIVDQGRVAMGAQLAEARAALLRHTGQRLQIVETRTRPPRIGWPLSARDRARFEADAEDRFEAGRRSAAQVSLPSTG